MIHNGRWDSASSARFYAGGMITDEERSERLATLDELIAMMAPSVQMDGGDLRLVSADPESGVVEVELVGACSSCAISSVTLQEGVSRLLKERLDWVTEVVGSVDESLSEEESMLLGRGGYVPQYRS